MLILGIETSCDDTSAAVLENKTVLSNLLSNQDDIHTKFGGIVPELASRKHVQIINFIVDSALREAEKKIGDIDLIAVTQGPGLIGSLLVGFSYAKALSHVSKTPFVGVDHLKGHILSVYLNNTNIQFPYISLVVSGGNSAIYLAKSFTEFSLLGCTRDDAAGEAFDKVSKLLGLPYPGGPHISKLAENGDPDSISFPRAWLEETSLDFSFSGLKTAVLNYINNQNRQNKSICTPDVCAAFQQAVLDVLVKKTINAAKLHKVNSIGLGGGVSANKLLREQFTTQCAKNNLNLYVPEVHYSTDNASMIALAGYYHYKYKGQSKLDSDVYSRSQLG